MRLGGCWSPHPPKYSSEAQGHYEQRTDELCRVDHEGKHGVGAQFEEHQATSRPLNSRTRTAARQKARTLALSCGGRRSVQSLLSYHVSTNTIVRDPL